MKEPHHENGEGTHHKHPRNHERSRIGREWPVHIIVAMNIYQRRHHHQRHKPDGHNKIAKHPSSS
jgi:hypothetical protein